MGFLDEVKQQNRAAQQSISESDLPGNTAPAHLQAVQPRLRALFVFLDRLASKLSAAPPKIRVGYQVSSFGKMNVLNQCGYAAIADNPDNPTHVVFQFACRGPRTLIVEANSRERNQWQQDYLLEHGLRFHCKSHADWRFTITVEEFVPVSFTFLADDREALIRLEVRNGDTLGTQRHTFKHEQIGADFMEELAKRVLRRANRFDELCGNRVSSDARRQLRAKIAARRFQREVELGDENLARLNGGNDRLFSLGIFRRRKTPQGLAGHAFK